MSTCKRGSRWSFKVYVDDINTGQRRQIERRGYATKRDARLAEIEFMNDQKNQIQLNRKISFREAYENYLMQKSKEWKDTSFYGNKIVLESRILNHFKDTDLIKINKTMINAWREKLNQMGFKQNYKNKLLTNLKGIFRYANNEYGINNFVMENEPPFKDDHYEIIKKTIYNESEFYKYSSAIDKIQYKAFFSLLYYSGMRIGEIRALKWKDIDFVQGKIEVYKSMTNKTFDKRNQIISPKTHNSIRSIFFPLNIIKPIFDTYIEETKKSKCFKSEAFIFGCDKPLPETSIRRMNLKIAQRAGLAPIRIHDFRHSYITMLYHRNIDLITVKDQVGHSSIKTTADIYMKLDAEKRKHNIESAFSDVN